MLSINREIDLILMLLANCNISYVPGPFATVDSKNFVPVVTLSGQNSSKLSRQFKSGSRLKSIWNKYQLKVAKQTQKQYLDYLINASC